MAFQNIINKSLENIALDALRGTYPIRINGPKETSLFGSGIAVNIGTNEITSAEPLKREVVSTTPNASVLVKNKFFSGFKHNNDLQWLDRTESLLLRSIKALMAYKVSQIRAYEAITKLEDYFREYNEINLNLYVDAFNQAQSLNIPQNQENSNLLSIIGGALNNVFSTLEYDGYKEDILKILQRNAFSSDIRLTTWIVDPTNVENYGTGPGTGVTEFTNAFTFSTTISKDTSPSAASLSMVDPYRIMNIGEDDIEIAINEALTGTVGLFENIINGEVGIENVDASSIVSAGLELLGLGRFDSTIDVDYIRERLRTFYLGKTMITAGDTIHFYIRSNKNLHTQDEWLDEGFFEIDETILEAERRLFTNNKVDFQTYKKIREYSDNSFGMRHVFAGVVRKTEHNYSNGSWKMRVEVDDNMKWLQWSRFMFEPALADPQGLLEDPLTPYALQTDASGRVLSANTGFTLLNENQQLINSGLLTYDSGIFNGQLATDTNLLQGQYNSGGSLQNQKIFQHASGLVYRWKRGILTATAPLNVVDPLNEDSVSLNNQRQFYALQVAQDVLTNLDVANILSILIVGQPYNINSFLQQSYQAHNSNATTASSGLTGLSPLASVLDVVRRQNRYFGNFRPYRMITLSDRTMNESFSNNLIKNEVNEKLRQLRSRRVSLARRVQELNRAIGGANPENPSLIVSTLNAEIADIDESIQAQIRLAQNQNVSSGGLLSENFNLFGTNRVLPLTGEFTADANVTRAMMLVGAQRRIEDVRLNRDDNLFIVSDQYDDNVDIRQFILALREQPYPVFQGQYVSVYEKCESAAKIPEFEFFCNTQGHLEFRPPQWNRTPLSILQELIRVKNERNINIIPDFLTDLFDTKASSLKINIHKLNIRIAIIALLLGRYPDRNLLPGIQRVGKDSLRFFGIKAAGTIGDASDPARLDLRNSVQTGLQGLSNSINQLFGNQLSLDAALSEDGDILNGDTSTLLGDFDPIFQENNNIFDGLTLNVNSGSGGPSARSEGYATPSAVNTLRDAFRSSYGEDPASGIASPNASFDIEDFAYSDPSTPDINSDVVSKINNLLSKLESTVSERDNLVRALNQVEAKQQELSEVEALLGGQSPDEIDEDDPEILQALDTAYNTVKSIGDVFSGEATKGSVFDHLIQDDTRNLLGPGSGRRFIIRDSDIIDASFSEQPPDFVRVNVYGNNPFIGDGLQSDFDKRYYWAGATDFDLWRQYGFKDGPDLQLPYANNPETQSRPFAQLSLQLQRVKINTGAIRVVGNEYYEPGDSVYIPTKGLMYYISSVSHAFDYGNSFTTSLTLINGHPPGVYLPSPLDILGQQLLKNDPTASILTYRNINGDDSYRALQPDTSIVFPPGPLLNTNQLNVLLDFRDNSLRFTNMMINLTSLVLGNRVVLIRAFSRGEADDDARVRNNLNVVRELLLNPQMITQDQPLSNINGAAALGDDILDSTGSALRGIGVETGSTKGTLPLQLPNGSPVIRLRPEQIVEQIVTLGPETVSEIRCLNAQLAESLNTGDSAILPKGGPKQRTWLDFRDDLTQVSNIIEIGILDIDRALDVEEDQSGVGVSVDVGL